MSVHPDLDTERKAWSTLVARAALKGWQLWRTDPDDGVQRYFLGRWGLVRAISDTDELHAVLDQTGA
jgi:glutaredoxin-related protein